MIFGIPVQAIIQGVINGLAMGWVYVLMAMGLTLIYGIMRIMQFAHGEIYMLGAYVVYYLAVSFGVPLLVSIIIGMIVIAVFGIALERFLFRPTKNSELGPFIMTTGLILILQSAAVIVFGVYQRHIPRLAKGSFQILGSFIPKDRIIAVCVAIVLSGALYLFLKKTKYGLAMVASAQDAEGAISLGINPNRMSALSMAMGCGLAAAGGALAGALFDVNPVMGFPALVKGLTILVLGGMGSLPGAIVGGIAIGMIDGIVPIVFGPALASIAPLLVVILILIIKPQGLFGHEGYEG